MIASPEAAPARGCTLGPVVGRRGRLSANPSSGQLSGAPSWRAALIAARPRALAYVGKVNGTSASCSTFIWPDRDRRQLSKLARALADDVAAEDVWTAVGDQLAEAGRATVDDRSRQRVEALRRDHDVVRITGCRLGEPDGGILGVGEAAERAHLRGERGVASEGRVGRCDVGLTHGLVDDHRVSGDVAGGEDVRRARAEARVDLDEATRVALYAGRVEIETVGVRDPADRDDDHGRVEVLPGTALRVDEADAAAHFSKRSIVPASSRNPQPLPAVRCSSPPRCHRLRS